MANSSRLTKYVSATTVVTADVANAWSGGLYGSSDAAHLDSDDPRVVGHTHDGQHLDGHAQKINLVNHVTGQLRNVNLGDDAVNRRNIESYLDQSDAIPISEIIDGYTYYYLDISGVTGSLNNRFTYLAGGTANPDSKIYDNWEDCYNAAAVAATDNNVEIFIDNTFATGEVTAGTYDFTNIKLLGAMPVILANSPFGYTRLTMGNGVIINNLHDAQYIDFNVTATDLDGVIQYEDGNIHPCLFTSCMFGAEDLGTAVISVDNSTTLSLELRQKSLSFGSEGGFLGPLLKLLDAGSTVTIGVDNSRLNADSISSIIGSTIDLSINDPWSFISDTQTDVNGTLNITYDSPAGRVSYDNLTSGLAAENVQDAIDELASFAGVSNIEYAIKTGTQNINSEVTVTYDTIVLNSADVTHSSGEFIIVNAGTYKVEWFFTGTIDSTGTVNIWLTDDVVLQGTDAETAGTRTATEGTDASFSLSAFAYVAGLETGDTLRIRAHLVTGADVTELLRGGISIQRVSL